MVKMETPFDLPRGTLIKWYVFPFFLAPCKPNQKCTPIRECPYTFKLMNQANRSQNRARKINIIQELKKLVCNSTDRTVCCDLQ